jgi:hypothetical protein
MDHPQARRCVLAGEQRPLGDERSKGVGVAVWTQSPFGLFRQIVGEVGASGDGPQPSTFGRDGAELAAALRDVGFQDVQVQTREMVSVLEGGIPQALEVAEATGGAVLASLSGAQQQAVREAMIRALEPLVKDGAVHLRSATNIAAAHTPA